MKRLFVLGLLFVAVFTKLQADDCCIDNGNCCQFAYDAGRYRISARGSAIYWTSYTDALSDYALFDKAFSSLIGINFASDFQLQEIELGWRWGFKVGLAYQFPCDCWTLDAQWARYRAQESAITRRTATGARTGFIGNDAVTHWDILSPSGGPNFIEGDLKLNYNTIDLSLNRDVYFSNRFALRALAGARGAIILERLKTSYSAGGTYSPTPEVSFMTVHNDFRGVGPTVGIAPLFNLGCGFSLDAQSYVSLLWGKFNLKQTNAAFDPFVPFTFPLITAGRHQNRLQPNIDLLVNLYWDWCFPCWKVGFSVGYEANYWINFVRQTRFNYFGPAFRTSDINSSGESNITSEQRRGDLALHGLNLTLNVSF